MAGTLTRNNYDFDLIWHGVTNDKSFTGDEIKNWCDFHRFEDGPRHWIAMVLWDKYFDENATYCFPLGSRTYYYVDALEGEKLESCTDPLKTVWVRRDHQKSPRKEMK